MAMTVVDFVQNVDNEGGFSAMADWGGDEAASGLPFEREWRDFVTALLVLERAVEAAEEGDSNDN